MREIGYKQFKDEEGLISVKIPDTVEDVSVEAFSGCRRLVSIEFYERKVLENKSLKERKFDRLSYIDDIRKNLSVLSPNSNPLFFRWNALDYCSSLERIVLPNRDVIFLCDVRFTKWWDSQPDGIIYLNNTLLGVKGECESHVELKEGTLAIAPRAFENCKQLQSVNIPTTIKHIGKFAFKNCVSLKSIVIPEGVLGIDEGAFDHCKSLESIDFPVSISVLKKIGWGMDRLTTIRFHGAPPLYYGRFCNLFTFIPKSLRVVMMHKNYFKQEMEFPNNIEIRFFENE